MLGTLGAQVLQTLSEQIDGADCEPDAALKSECGLHGRELVAVERCTFELLIQKDYQRALHFMDMWRDRASFSEEAREQTLPFYFVLSVHLLLTSWLDEHQESPSRRFGKALSKLLGERNAGSGVVTTDSSTVLRQLPTLNAWLSSLGSLDSPDEPEGIRDALVHGILRIWIVRFPSFFGEGLNGTTMTHAVRADGDSKTLLDTLVYAEGALERGRLDLDRMQLGGSPPSSVLEKATLASALRITLSAVQMLRGKAVESLQSCLKLCSLLHSVVVQGPLTSPHAEVRAWNLLSFVGQVHLPYSSATPVRMAVDNFIRSEHEVSQTCIDGAAMYTLMEVLDVFRARAELGLTLLQATPNGPDGAICNGANVMAIKEAVKSISTRILNSACAEQTCLQFIADSVAHASRALSMPPLRSTSNRFQCRKGKPLVQEGTGQQSETKRPNGLIRAEAIGDVFCPGATLWEAETAVQKLQQVVTMIDEHLPYELPDTLSSSEVEQEQGISLVSYFEEQVSRINERIAHNLCMSVQDVGSVSVPSPLRSSVYLLQLWQKLGASGCEEHQMQISRIAAWAYSHSFTDHHRAVFGEFLTERQRRASPASGLSDIASRRATIVYELAGKISAHGKAPKAGPRNRMPESSVMIPNLEEKSSGPHVDAAQAGTEKPSVTWRYSMELLLSLRNAPQGHG
eukprot:scaffold1190_cov393-Prasinococcus_capsulatus_cf.AAC.8